MAEKIRETLNSEEHRSSFIPLKEFDSRRNGYLYFYPIATGNVFSEKYIQSYLCCIIDQDMAREYFSGILKKKWFYYGSGFFREFKIQSDGGDAGGPDRRHDLHLLHIGIQ